MGWVCQARAAGQPILVQAYCCAVLVRLAGLGRSGREAAVEPGASCAPQQGPQHKGGEGAELAGLEGIDAGLD